MELLCSCDGALMLSVCKPVQVWRQKAQYLQHKQNKAEATTVKHKGSSEGKSKGIFDTSLINNEDSPLI